MAVTYEFADMSAFGRWYHNVTVQRTLRESREYCERMVSEVWGGSPAVPNPVHPQGVPGAGNPWCA